MNFKNCHFATVANLKEKPSVWYRKCTSEPEDQINDTNSG